jgi:hypothetical protein
LLHQLLAPFVSHLPASILHRPERLVSLPPSEIFRSVVNPMAFEG